MATGLKITQFIHKFTKKMVYVFQNRIRRLITQDKDRDKQKLQHLVSVS